MINKCISSLLIVCTAITCLLGAITNPRPAYLETPIVNIDLLEKLNFTP